MSEDTKRDPISSETSAKPVLRQKRSKKWRSLVVLLVLFLAVIFPCVVTPRGSGPLENTVNRMNRIGSAVNAYHEKNKQLLPAVVRDKDGHTLYSWRVLILPYLELGDVHEKFNYDEPWDSPQNLPLSKTTPRCYLPEVGKNDNPGMTHYQVFIGPGTAFERTGLNWNDFPEERANTILVVEAAEPVLWSKPSDLAYDPDRPLPGLGSGISKPIRFLCRDVGRRPGFTACFADGSARFIPSSTDEMIIRALITWDGGEKVDVSSLE